MKLLLAVVFLLLAIAGHALASDLPAALQIGQVLQQRDTSVALFPQNFLPPGLPDKYALQDYGLLITVQSGRPNAATLQIKALIETDDGLRRWFRTEVPYELPASGSAWIPVWFSTGKRHVVAVYGLKVTVIDAGQEQAF
jgi:hypothetical protein